MRSGVLVLVAAVLGSGACSTGSSESSSTASTAPTVSVSVTFPRADAETTDAFALLNEFRGGDESDGRSADDVPAVWHPGTEIYGDEVPDLASSATGRFLVQNSSDAEPSSFGMDVAVFDDAAVVPGAYAFLQQSASSAVSIYTAACGPILIAVHGSPEYTEQMVARAATVQQALEQQFGPCPTGPANAPIH
jgi:hypothetical protein